MKDILKHPLIYNFLQNMLSKKRSSSLFINKYLKPHNGDRILDLGCGTGRLLNLLPDNISYTGIDISEKYIHHARNNFGIRGEFIHGDILEVDCTLLGPFDLVIARGFFHHVEDSVINILWEHLKPSLSGNVRLVSIDGCYAEGQHFISKFFLDIDRGNYIRTEKEYVNILNCSFNKVESILRDDPITNIDIDNTICFKYRIMVVSFGDAWLK